MTDAANISAQGGTFTEHLSGGAESDPSDGAESGPSDGAETTRVVAPR